MRVLACLLILFPMTAFAAQPRLPRAIESFKKSPEVRTELRRLNDRGYFQKGSSAAVIYGQLNDEGLDADYFVSVYLEKGDDPHQRVAAVVCGIVNINAGFVRSVNRLNCRETAEVLSPPDSEKKE